MSTQWFRRYQLIVGKSGDGLSIDNLRDAPSLRIKFEIRKSLQKEPNPAKFDIYNLSPVHVNSLQNEYTDLSFRCGYSGNVKQLFSGNTQFVSYYHDKADTICEVICGDGDLQYRQSFVNVTFSKGTTDEQIVDYCLKQLPGIQKGTMQLGSTGALRGRSFSAMTRDALDEIARSNGCNWSIQDGTLHMVRADAMLDANNAQGTSNAIVLTPETGLLQAAERSARGISATCLLNPDIRVNAAVRLDNSAIRVRFARNRQGKQQVTNKPPVSLNKDGIYKVFRVQHSGDTRDSQWTSEIMCVGLGQPVPTSTSNIGGAGAVPVEGWEGGDDDDAGGGGE